MFILKIFILYSATWIALKLCPCLNLKLWSLFSVLTTVQISTYHPLLPSSRSDVIFFQCTVSCPCKVPSISAIININFQEGPSSYLGVEGTKGGEEGAEQVWKQSTLPEESM